MEIVILIIILIITSFLGYKAIIGVPSLLHTPLMSVMGGLSGVIFIGGLTLTAILSDMRIFGYLAIIFGAINASAGLLITHKMLEMFQPKRK